MKYTLFFIFLIIGYGLGSLSSAIIVSKLMKLQDPRTGGSKNPGTTNVLRLSGKFPAVIVLVCDILKGFLPVIIGLLLGLGGLSATLIGLAAIVGHMYPAYYQFKGGKGVATALGVLFALSIYLFIAVIIIWLLVAIITRFSSLASMIAIGLSPALATYLTNPHYFPGLVIIAILIICKHWENILRLIEGKESKIKLKRQAVNDSSMT